MTVVRFRTLCHFTSCERPREKNNYTFNGIGSSPFVWNEEGPLYYEDLDFHISKDAYYYLTLNNVALHTLLDMKFFFTMKCLSESVTQIVGLIFI